jgi:hypothetical protein
MLDNEGKGTDIHSEHLIPIAFQLQKWVRERASIKIIRTLPVSFTRYGRAEECIFLFLATLSQVNLCDTN